MDADALFTVGSAQITWRDTRRSQKSNIGQWHRGIFKSLHVDWLLFDVNYRFGYVGYSCLDLCTKPPVVTRFLVWHLSMLSNLVSRTSTAIAYNWTEVLARIIDFNFETIRSKMSNIITIIDIGVAWTKVTLSIFADLFFITFTATDVRLRLNDVRCPW